MARARPIQPTFPRSRSMGRTSPSGFVALLCPSDTDAPLLVPAALSKLRASHETHEVHEESLKMLRNWAFAGNPHEGLLLSARKRRPGSQAPVSPTRELRERSRDSRATRDERHKLLQEHDYSGPTEKAREEDKIAEMPRRVRESGKPPQTADAIGIGDFPPGRRAVRGKDERPRDTLALATIRGNPGNSRLRNLVLSNRLGSTHIVMYGRPPFRKALSNVFGEK